jgi:hypothetical protein
VEYTQHTVRWEDPPMTPWGDYRAKLIEIADRIARDGAQDNPDFLRRFRAAYRHLVATVDGTASELGLGPFGIPDMGPMTPMRPDVTKLLGETDSEIDKL